MVPCADLRNCAAGKEEPNCDVNWDSEGAGINWFPSTVRGRGSISRVLDEAIIAICCK